MKFSKNRLLDLLLYPAGMFEKLTDSRAALYAGILLVGAIDLLLPEAGAFLKRLFSDKPEGDVFFNAAAAALMIVLLGVIDVIFVSVPLYDFFKYLKKKEEANAAELGEDNAILRQNASRIKLMKIYIMSHFIIVPVSTLVYFLFVRDLKPDSPAWVQNLLLVYFMLIMIWAAAILTRGINTLFRFNPIFRKLTFIVVFSWTYLFGLVFNLQIVNWLLKIFK